jgi:hypothetical protein
MPRMRFCADSTVRLLRRHRFRFDPASRFAPASCSLRRSVSIQKVTRVPREAEQDTQQYSGGLLERG